MYAAARRRGLGASTPVNVGIDVVGNAIIPGAGPVIAAIESLFGASGNTISAQAKAVIDGYIQAVLVDPSQISVDGSNEQYNWMKLRCCSGDSTPSLLTWEQTIGGDPSATVCGCADQAKRSYASYGLQQVSRALQGLPLTSYSTSVPVTTTTPVTLALPISKETILGVPVLVWGVGLVALGYLVSNPKRRR